MKLLSHKSTAKKLAVFVSCTLVAPFALAIQCVPYAQGLKPGGYDWTGLFPKIENGKPLVTSCKATDEGKKCARWYAGKELGNTLYVVNRGSTPKVNAMMIFPSYSASPVGHVAVVTSVGADGWIYVKHANFDKSEEITTGSYKIKDNRATYRTSKGVVWSTTYPFSHYVYKPS